MAFSKPIIFVACGQYTAKEKELGKAVAALVETLTPFDGYFAENQNTFQGLTQDILGALNRSVGFIGIMHSRGQVEAPSGQIVRASIWIEQEIAIAAFLDHILGRDLRVRAYVQRGIAREGMRDKLHLNPVEFESDDEVLEDLKTVLPTWGFRQIAGPQLEVSMDYLERNITQQRHDYQLRVWLENKGQEAVKEWWVEILFPRSYMDPARTLLMEKPERGTPEHRFIRVTQSNRPNPVLYPGDREMIQKIHYFVDTALSDRPDPFAENVIVTVKTPRTEPRTLEKSMRELQRF